MFLFFCKITKIGPWIKMLEKLTRTTVMSIEFSRQKSNSGGKLFCFLNKIYTFVFFHLCFSVGFQCKEKE